MLATAPEGDGGGAGGYLDHRGSCEGYREIVKLASPFLLHDPMLYAALVYACNNERC